jgi:RNA polymerase sigma-70 factor
MKTPQDVLHDHLPALPWLVRIDTAVVVTFLTTAAASGAAIEQFGRDLLLVFGCVRGETRAIAELEVVLQGHVRPIIRRVRSDESFVADVMQALREQLLVSENNERPRLARYQGHGALKSWLGTIAFRLALSEERKRIVHAGDQDEHAAVFEPVDRPALGDFRESFASALGLLGEESCKLLHAFYLEGRTLEAISEETGMSRATLSRRIAEAREQLRAGVGVLDDQIDLGTLADASSVGRILAARAKH